MCGVIARCASPKSLSKRARSTTPTSLRLESSTYEQSPKIIAHADDFRDLLRIPFAISEFGAQSARGRGNCVRPPNVPRSLTAIYSSWIREVFGDDWHPRLTPALRTGLRSIVREGRRHELSSTHLAAGHSKSPGGMCPALSKNRFRTTPGSLRNFWVACGFVSPIRDTVASDGRP